MISIIIPTYKNHMQFLKNLRHNLQFLKNEEVIIVNDNPDHSLKDELKPWTNIQLIEHKKNMGFGKSINDGVKKASQEILMLLNDDVVLQDTSYEKSIPMFYREENLFAVSFSQIEKNRDVVGKNKLFWQNGLIHHSGLKSDTPGNNAWAEGGACLIKRDLFKRLGGLDPDYSPFYWEDIDLSYKAWKNGYRVLFNPETKVIHYHESTIGMQFNKQYVKSIAFRNQFLFIWKNITDIDFIISHALLLPVNLMYYLFKGEFAFVKGFFMALVFLPGIKRHAATVSDKNILKNF